MAGRLSPENAWARPLTWAEALAGDSNVRLSADAKTRMAIAGDLDLEDLASLEAQLSLRPWLDGVSIEGRLRAVATRICGLSLEPFEVEIDEPIAVRIVPAGSVNAPQTDDEVIVDLDAEDPPDIAEDGVIDLAAYVIEALALALDPFPRKPGAIFEPPEPTAPISPFAALSALTKRPS
jgi:hypothetical protein